MHPPPDPLKKSANLFERFDYLVKAALWLVEEALNTRHQLEAIMATVQELQTALDANTAATAQAQAAIASEITDLAAAIAALVPGEAVTQAQLDQLNASTASLQAAVSALGADDTNPAAGV
jgi:multidrug resistance efflux pump